MADGTANGIDYLFAGTICHGGPGPGFIAPWVYKYITHRLQDVLEEWYVMNNPISALKV